VWEERRLTQSRSNSGGTADIGFVKRRTPGKSNTSATVYTLTH